jgi:hypothetical protein
VVVCFQLYFPEIGSFKKFKREIEVLTAVTIKIGPMTGISSF